MTTNSPRPLSIDDLEQVFFLGHAVYVAPPHQRDEVISLMTAGTWLIVFASALATALVACLLRVSWILFLLPIGFVVLLACSTPEVRVDGFFRLLGMALGADKQRMQQYHNHHRV